MKKRFRCENCNKEFTTDKDCREHEKTCQPRSLEDRVEELERRVANLQAALMQLWRMPATTPTAPAPHNPYDGPWGPATCVAGEGPWGPLNKKVHRNVCDDCVNRDKRPDCIDVSWDSRNGGRCRNYTRGAEATDRAECCSTCEHFAEECGPVTMTRTTAGGAWHCSGYSRKPCK